MCAHSDFSGARVFVVFTRYIKSPALTKAQPHTHITAAASAPYCIRFLYVYIRALVLYIMFTQVPAYTYYIIYTYLIVPIYTSVFIMCVLLYLYLYIYTYIGSGDPLRTIGRETPYSTFIIHCPIDRVAQSSPRASVYNIIIRTPPMPPHNVTMRSLQVHSIIIHNNIICTISLHTQNNTFFDRVAFYNLTYGIWVFFRRRVNVYQKRAFKRPFF